MVVRGDIRIVFSIFRDGNTVHTITTHPGLKGGDGQWLVLDYVILSGLKLLWR
jgi:hypothetical protein